jgi:hypothetical protein
VAIEGMGQFRNVRAEQPATERLEAWISELRAVEARQTRRYRSLDDAHARMVEENPHLTAEQAQHLTHHGAESGRVDPRSDGRLKLFKDARSITIERAGHWVHHDRLDAFVEAVGGFLAGPEPNPSPG